MEWFISPMRCTWRRLLFTRKWLWTGVSFRVKDRGVCPLFSALGPPLVHTHAGTTLVATVSMSSRVCPPCCVYKALDSWLSSVPYSLHSFCLLFQFPWALKGDLSIHSDLLPCISSACGFLCMFLSALGGGFSDGWARRWPMSIECH